MMEAVTDSVMVESAMAEVVGVQAAVVPAIEAVMVELVGLGT